MVLVAVVASTAFAASKEAKLRAALPRGSPYKEALLTSTWFSNAALIGPIGGPTRGYDLALQLWPRGPTLVLAGNYGKDELASNPEYLSLERPKLLLLPAPDGHAVSWSVDGKKFHVVYLDGPIPFFCPHEAVAPGAMPRTAELAERVLRGSGHPELDVRPQRGALSADRRQELRGALAFARSKAAGPKLAALAEIWLAAPANASVIDVEDLRDLEEEVAPPAPPPVVPPKPNTCKATPPELGPLPAVLDEEVVLARLSFPSWVDDKTCAAVRALGPRLEEYARALPEPKSDGGVPPRGANLFMSNCGTMVGAYLPQLQVWSPSARGLIAAYEEELLGCGHVDERDEKCERALLASKKAEWAKVIESARLERCAAHQEMLEVIRSCLATLRAGPQTPSSWEQTRYVWTILGAMPRALEPVFCPARPAEWPSPRPR